MTSRTKKLVFKRRGAQVPGESSHQGSARTRHPAPPPPPPQPPRPPRRQRKILSPRWVNFADLAMVLPTLEMLFGAQGWAGFMANHRAFYPALVREFYDNLIEHDHELFSVVKGKRIQISAQVIGAALRLPNEGSLIELIGLSEDEVYTTMTGLSPQRDSPWVIHNANTFPPLQRLIHHMFTTIIYPKGGSRNEVTKIHKSLFQCLFQYVALNLPHLMCTLIDLTFRDIRRSLPYAAPLTALFTLVHVDLRNEEKSEIPSYSIYTQFNICRFMKYKVEDGEFVRGYDEESESEEEEEAQAQEAQAELPEPMQEEQPQGEPAHAPDAQEAPQAEEAPWPAEDTMATHAQLQQQIHTLRGEMHDFRRAHDARLDALSTVLDGRLDALQTGLAELRLSHSTAVDAQTIVLDDLLRTQREMLARMPPRQDS